MVEKRQTISISLYSNFLELNTNTLCLLSRIVDTSEYSKPQFQLENFMFKQNYETFSLLIFILQLLKRSFKNILQFRKKYILSPDHPSFFSLLDNVQVQLYKHLTLSPGKRNISQDEPRIDKLRSMQVSCITNTETSRMYTLTMRLDHEITCSRFSHHALYEPFNSKKSESRKFSEVFFKYKYTTNNHR